MQKLTEAFQGPVVETKQQAQDKLETTWDAAAAAADNAVDELLGDEGMTKLDSPTTTQPKTEDKPLDTVEKEDLKVDTVKKTAVVTPTTTEYKTIAAKEKAAPAVETKTELKPKTENAVTKEQPKVATKSLKSPEGVRIPDVISAEFGKPLEVETANVNPLRHPPKRGPITKTEPKAEKPKEEVSPKKEEPKPPNSVVASKPLGSSGQVATNDEQLAETKRKQEQFQRNLLETRFNLESKSKAKQGETTSPDAASSEDQRSTSSEDKDSAAGDGVPPTFEKSIVPTAAESQGESIELIRDFLSQPPSKPSPISIPNISESRLKSIIEARRQPKACDEEASVAQRYSRMSMGDRAFAILFDLGMVEQNKDPKDPSYDHSDDDSYCEHLDLST
ncbi:MAG: hypothetical protein SGILL_009882 [Bacillariaceae sp.]